MVAGALRDAGYHMGHEPLPSTPSNPKGYFEDRAVNELNEELLAQVVRTRPTGRRGRLLPPYPQRLAHGHLWLAPVGTQPRFKITPAITARMRALTATGPFCFKDPRFCYTLEQWRPVLGDAVFVCVFREPSRTATSIIKDCCEREYLSGVRMTRRRALRVWSLMYRHV